MKSKMSLAAIALMALSMGCEKKDQDAAMAQGRMFASKAQDMAGSAWKSVSEQAQKLSADSGKSAIESAKSQLESVRDRMSHIKAPTEIEGLKLDTVKDEIQRLEAALTIKNLKSQMDKRVEDAQKMKDNAQKSVQEIRDKLSQAEMPFITRISRRN